MQKTIRIGTRDSELALWQAKTVEKKLNDLGFSTQLVPIKSEGDLELNIPLYEMGITGIFTKTLDVAMLQGKIDIAVHSMKDVPTQLPKGIVQVAVLERATTDDILVFNEMPNFEQACTIATGSLRRKAQWLHKYPTHTIVDLRGNVNTRLKKVAENKWQGAIFAAAGLERLNLKPSTFQTLDWMLPAPAQGAMMVVALANDTFIQEALAKLNHAETEICTHIERQFLQTLEGGCTAPIGAKAVFTDTETIRFKGNLFDLDGQTFFEIEKYCKITDYKNFGKLSAEELLNNGANTLMKELRKSKTI